MKKKKPGKVILFSLAAASFLIAVLEGLIYYSKYQQTWFFELILVLQNSVKAFLFSPDLSAEDVLDSLQSAAAGWEYIVGCAYVAAVFVAPLCTATAALRTIELLLRRGVRRAGREKNISLVYGWNSAAEAILTKRGKEDNDPVYLVTEEKLSDEKQLALARHNVYPCKAGEEKKLRGRAGRFFLLDESSIKNFSTYAELQHWWESARTAEAAPQVVCACEDDGIRSLIVALHDSTRGRNGEALPVALFSMAQLKARTVWEAYPICAYNFGEDYTGGEESRYDVHMLLVGLGRIGRELLRQAISLSVLSTDSRVVFDVVDRNAEELLGFFAADFDPGYAQVDRSALTLSIPSEKADGSLTIRFHRLDVDDGAFRSLLERLNAEMAFTYAAICLESPDAAVRCLFSLDHVLRAGKLRIPVAVRMELSKEVSGQLRDSELFYAHVFPFCCSDDPLTLDYLANEDAYKKAMEFNSRYNQWSDALGDKAPAPSDPEKEWRALVYFKQASSLHQYLHQAVKEARWAFERARSGDGAPLSEKERGQLELLGKPPLTGALALEFARLEHRRWCYYMATTGWGYAGKKDERARKNPCMTPWDTLCKKRPDTCPYDTTPYRMLTGTIPTAPASEENEQKEGSL